MSYRKSLMLKFNLLLIILLAMGITIACAKEETGISGRWKGAIVVNGQELNIYVNFRESEQKLEGVIDIPQQNVKNYALQNIKYDKDDISFELPSGNIAKFSGHKSKNKINGEFVQGQFKGKFYLNKVKEGNNISSNSEEKDKNFEGVQLDTEVGLIYGTLKIAESKEETTPVVLIIAGSGPTDRNGNSAITGENNSYKMVADQLASKGISSLRYDKRGVAGSTDVEITEKDLRFKDFINDAVGWIKLLKKDKRFSDLYVLGHSQGSLIGMVAARKEGVDGFISLAGPGQPISNTLREQLSTLPGSLKEEADDILTSLENGETVPEVGKNLQSILRPSIQPFLISYIKYDPSEEISKLKNIPVLIIQGTTDLQVSERDAKDLKNAYPEARLGIIEGMNHILKEAPSDPQKNAATYSKPDLPLADGLVEMIVDFIKRTG